MRTVRLGACSVLLAAAAAGQPDLRFRPGSGGEFVFDTGVLRGVLRASGKVSGGLTDVVHVPSGKKISGTHGLFGHYRVFADGRRFLPDGWAFASEAKLAPDGSVTAHWPAAEGRPFEMWAVYRWVKPDTFDVETRVRAQSDLRGFESFLASYFAEPFVAAGAWVEPGRFAAAEPADGPWQMFPRDAAAPRLIEDGRWKFPPNPVDWKIRTTLAFPLAIRRDAASGLAAAVMAPASGCFAVAMPHQVDSHRSLYLSLFGRDLKAGERASVRARIVIGALGDEEMVGRVREFQP
jgi:hypothetical protein